MRSKLNILLNLAIFLSFIFACETNQKENETNQHVIICGQILGYDMDSNKNAITAFVNDTGLATQLQYTSNIDSLGCFRVEFDRYYPQDILLSYKSNFELIVHPGDSIYIEFNGKTDKKSEVLSSLGFFGNAAKLNTNLTKYLKSHYENQLSQEFLEKKSKNLEPAKYRKFQDSLKNLELKFKDAFFKTTSKERELEEWVDAKIEYSYVNDLVRYTYNHKRLNKFPRDWTVDSSFYTFFDAIMLSKPSLINSNIVWVINDYKNHLSRIANNDSLFVSVIKQIPNENNLLKQLLLSSYVNTNLARSETRVYEKYEREIKELITENFLFKPLQEAYLETKNPICVSNIEIVDTANQSGIEIWKNIREESKGKVIYIDNWATWCIPCIYEFPNLNNMIEEYKTKDIDFIFLNMDSKKQGWERALSKYKINGKHYFINKEQGGYLKKMFEIDGYPTYLIIDKKGDVFKKGSHLKPSNVETKNIINALLKTD